MSCEATMIGLYEKACTMFYSVHVSTFIYSVSVTHLIIRSTRDLPLLGTCHSVASGMKSWPSISSYDWQLESNTRVLDLESSGLSIWSCVLTQHVFQCQLLGYQFIPPTVHCQTKHLRSDLYPD